MNDADRQLVELASTQDQVFTRAQALEAGLTYNGIARRLAAERLVAVGPRALTFGGVSLSWRGKLRAGLFDLGGGALVSGESAAALHGLDGFEPGPLVFLVPRTHRFRRTVGTVTSSAELNGLDRTVRPGLPTTSGTRTVIELLGRVSQTALGNALDSAYRLGLTTAEAVERRLGALGRSGRAGVNDLDAVLELRGVQSWLERLFLELVATAGLPPPDLQRVYRRDGRHVARVDFDFTPLPLVVEVGGRRGYMSATERQRQERRRNELQLLARTVFCFTTEDVRDDPTYVIATLTEALLARAS